MLKDKSFVSLVFKIENSDHSYTANISAVESFLSKNFEYYEIILVLNGTSARSKNEINQTLSKSSFKNLTILWLKQRIHSEHAMLAGVQRSIGDFIYQIPFPNFDFENSLFVEMLTSLREGEVDVVAAIPQGNIPLSSKIFYRVFNSLSVSDAALSTERILLTSRRSINAASKIRQNLKYFKLLLAQAGYQRSSLSFEAKKTEFPLQQASSTERMELAFDLLLNYSVFGSRISFVMTAMMILFAIAVGVYSIYSYLYFNVVSGWTSMMIFVSVSFAGVFFMLAILASSVRKLIDMIQNDSAYKVEEILHIKQSNS